MNQAQMQAATDQVRKDGKGAGGAVFGLAVWGFVLWALYGYFFG